MRTGSVSGPAGLAPQDRARRRSYAALRWLRLLGVAVALLVIAGSVWTHPRPGLHGQGLVILVALACLALATVSLMAGRPLPRLVLLALSAVLVLSSAALIWLQPRSLGVLGMFVAVNVAAARLHGRTGAAVAVLALAALAVSELVLTRSSPVAVANGWLGVVAFYVMGVLGYRLQQGQERAERLLAELEQSKEAEAQAAALAERTRLAREMHDVLAHSLSALALQLGGARLLAAQSGADPELGATLDRAHHLARTGLEEARRAIGMLREEALPGPERLGELAGGFERDTGVPCTLAVGGEERELSPEARLTLYRVAQEALTNVRRHARAERVELRLSYEPDGVCLMVEDFGRPERGVSVAGNGYGLTGMRERAELLGGKLVAEPTESGFRVELWVPA